MRSLFLLFSLSLLWLSAPAAAQPALDMQLKRLHSVSPKSKTPGDCEVELAKADRLNAFDLFYGATVCFAAERFAEGNFLLAAGQIRAMPDMVTLKPASKADEATMASLYGLIFFYLGGPGRDEALTDAAASARMFSLLGGWAPRLEPDYDPGWKVAARPRASEYQISMAESRRRRETQLRAIVRAYSDPQYYALHQEFEALQARVKVFETGTADAKLADDLQARMEKRRKQLGVDFNANGS